MSRSDVPGHIAGYEILEEIGEGGMGHVYKARDESGQLVAIKIAKEVVEDTLARQRFLNESLLSLNHPNIVKVLDVGTSDNSTYLVYNYLEGETLEEILERGPMPEEDIVSMGLQLAAGLAAAHDAGVVHRDVKPANVIRSPEGHYTLIDFGVALWDTDATRVTAQGQILGTPAYLPPEQARGEIDIDCRTDIWSLGILLYQAASGVSPFQRDAVLATMLAVVMDEPAPLGDVAPESSAELRVAVMRALRKSRDERWQDVRELADALTTLPTSRGATVQEEETLNENERRLVVVLLAENLIDPIPLGHAVGARGGVFIQLRNDRAVGIFGGKESQGDELVRAAQVGLECLGTAKRLAVASGHAVGQRSVVSGTTLAFAEEACALDLGGLAVDPASARALAGRFDVQARNGGHLILGARDTEGQAGLLIGRELELAQVLREVELVAEEGEARLVLITGPRGIGKSSLLRSVDAGLRSRVDNAIILRAHAEANDRDRALALISSLVETHLGEALSHLSSSAELDSRQIETLLDPLPPEERQACADFLAELIGAPTSESVQVQAARADPQLRRDQIRSAIGNYLRSVATTRPVILLVEDLHWCDPSSLQMLSELVLLMSTLPLGIIATALPENEEEYGSLLESQPHAHIPLGPLSRIQVAKLAEAICCQPLPAGLAVALAKRTHGNPLFVEHLVRDMYEDRGDITEVREIPLPPTVEAAVQSRLDNLGPTVKSLCKRAAVFTHAFSAQELAAFGTEDCTESLQHLVRRGVLGVANVNSRDRRYIFRSRLVAEVAYGMLLDEQRQSAHLSAAQILSVRRPGSPEDIARHFHLGGSPNDAAHWYVQATRLAAQRGDSDTVLRCSTRAMQSSETVPRFELYMARSDAFRFLGQREEQAEELEMALEAAASTSESAQAMTELAWNLSRTGKVPRALQMAEMAVDAARDTEDQECLALALGWRAVALAQLGRLDDAVDALGEATRTATGTNERVEALAADWRAQVFAARGDIAQRLQAFIDAEAKYTSIGDVRRAAGAACNVADLYNRLGDFRHAEKELLLAREGCRRVNNRLVEGYATANLGYALMHQGRIQEACAEFDRALMLADDTNESVLRMVIGLYRCRAQLAQSPTRDIIDAAQGVADEAREVGLAPLAALALSVASSAALINQDVEFALRLAQQAMAIRDELGGVEEDEADLFLAYARALESSGAMDAARAVRQRGKERIQAIASGITDSQLRSGYLSVPENAELLR
jgi:tetratricopeptide (TPR) repeat protein/energy-coupling factor transporter ATP-binding protein EcfA2